MTSEIERGTTALLYGILIFFEIFLLPIFANLGGTVSVDALLYFSIFGLFPALLAAFVLESLESIPIRIFFWGAFAGLICIVCLPTLRYLIRGDSVGILGLSICWSLTNVLPILIYILGADSEKAEKNAIDRQILAIAKKYGGILTPSVVVWELEINLKQAKKLLEKYVKYGEASKRTIGLLTIYDFPSTRAYLSQIDNEIIELLRNNPNGLSKVQILQTLGFSIESIDEALKRLELNGIIHYNIESDTYMLKGLMQPT